ncbi:hypothetical protein LU604_04625 [Erwinia tracheiphila]|uniref:CdiI immunity protein domain-containing protein n=1 Tax=Erwinia tracheiphila TaxID=65700 RepID=A0A345CU80_9GAMM|nr:contact-dependent growth inhibition system immunity protein [Erwinia tracheiphila]AXF76997.1 hypothetical protein AV903_14710 [Erwinia tracheiphila]UIA84319.1 hypothetical protein LU604_04625 [Erwinia tracheiphila]UIA92902.1 hypothetical protein LU632_04585 [Erwinia tracheiphila]
MKPLNLNELGCFITIYFGQDYDLIDDSDEIEPKIDAFLRDAHRANKYGLIADIDQLTDQSKDLEKAFAGHFGDEFAPELWGTTATGFLKLVREKVSASLEADEQQRLNCTSSDLI